MTILRDIFRRRARSALTIAGISIGMFALVVLGAMSENMNVYIERATMYFRNVAMVMDEGESGPMGMPAGNRPLPTEKIEQVTKVPGVAACLPAVMLLLEESNEAMSTSAPPMIMGLHADTAKYEKIWGMEHGRFYGPGETGVVVLGHDIARQRRLGVGDAMEIRGEEFKVIGIEERTYISLNDASVYIPLDDARRMYVADLPEAFRKAIKPKEANVSALLYPEPGRRLPEVVSAVEREVSGVKALDYDRLSGQMASYIAIFNAVLGGLAALGLIIGGLTIVNTMTMSVAERTRELGVKRALGASRGRIARDVLLESAVMGGLGGALGLALGALASVGLGAAVMASTGTNMFMMTWRLVVFAMGFSVFLGTFAGLYPAWQAARMDPVLALAYE